MDQKLPEEQITQPQAPLPEERPSNGLPKILVVLILILIAYISGAGFYLWKSGGQI